MTEFVKQLPKRSGGPEWLTALQDQGRLAVERDGFPTKKHEAWRFTNVDPILRTTFTPAAVRPLDSPERVGKGTAREVFEIEIADGIPRIPDSFPSGVQLLNLAGALESDERWLADHLGRLASLEHFAGLNSAAFTDALVVRVRETATVRVTHVARASAQPRVAYPRVLVVAERGARLALIESFRTVGDGDHLLSSVAEVFVADDARVEHVRAHFGDARGYHIGTLAVHQGRDSRYHSQVVTLGGALSRLDLHVALAGQGAECTLDGVYHAYRRELVDHHTVIDHQAPDCTSHENYRGILDGRGRAVFDGTIIVRRDSQHTDAHQENRNLLLSDDAVVNTKPHLEIDADDVKCSHGATIGSLDEDQLFYLRARGIGEVQARALLTVAFIRSLLDQISNDAVRYELVDRVLTRLPEGATIRGEL